MLYGHYDTCLELLKAGSDVNRVESEHGLSPLHLAIQEGHERIVELLLNFGSNLLYKPPNNGLNAIEWASKLGQEPLYYIDIRKKRQEIYVPVGPSLEFPILLQIWEIGKAS